MSYYNQDKLIELENENTLLKAKLAEIEAQEPFGEIEIAGNNSKPIFYLLDKSCDLMTYDCFKVYTKQVQPSPAVVVPECFMRCFEHAKAMRFGTDWNNGTQARNHRKALCDATFDCEAMLATPTPPSADHIEQRRTMVDQVIPHQGEILAALDNGQNISLLADVKRAIAKLQQPDSSPSAEQDNKAKIKIQIMPNGHPHISNFSKIDLPQGFYDCVILPKIEQPDSAAVEPDGYVIVANERPYGHVFSSVSDAQRSIREVRSVGGYLPDDIRPFYFDKPQHFKQRITEQDAYEIITSFANIDLGAFDYWLENEFGRSILAKLNEHKGDLS